MTGIHSPFSVLRELHAKATPGPWERGTGSRLTIWAGGRCIFEDSFTYATLADADLIVATVNALPALLGEPVVPTAERFCEACGGLLGAAAWDFACPWHGRTDARAVEIQRGLNRG